MIRAYVDTNVFLNVWNEEIDPKSGKELWKGSKGFLKRIESGEYEGITSIRFNSVCSSGICGKRDICNKRREVEAKY